MSGYLGKIHMPGYEVVASWAFIFLRSAANVLSWTDRTFFWREEAAEPEKRGA
jgi:hypothetical protein